MPSRRHRSFTVVSRLNPSKTMRIFSSGVYLRRGPCSDTAHEAPCLLCALLGLGGLFIYLGHYDSFQLWLIYPSEGASNTPRPGLFGFPGLNTVQLR